MAFASSAGAEIKAGHDTHQTHSVADKPTIKLAYVSYPPYYGDSLEHGGPLTRIIEESFIAAGYQVEREQLPWARAYQWTQEGQYDALYSAWHREEREAHFIFSAPLPPNEVVLFSKREVIANIRQMTDLQRFTLGVVRGYAEPPQLEALDLRYDEVTSDTQNILKLAKGYIDFTVIDRALAQYLIQRDFPAVADDYAAMLPALVVEPQYLIFSRKARNVQRKVREFNAAYTALEASGRVAEILQEGGIAP